MGIPQARILEWVAYHVSGGSSWPGIELGSPTLQADSLPDEPPGKPSLMYVAAAAAAAKSLQSCPTLCDPIDGSPPGFPHPWDSPGKNIGVCCHFLLQCMKVKSESEVAQSCRTRSNPMDCSLPGSSVHGIFQARVLEWGAIAFSTLMYNYLQIHQMVYIKHIQLGICQKKKKKRERQGPAWSVLFSTVSEQRMIQWTSIPLLSH